MHFESQGHVLVHHSILVDDLNLQGLVLLYLLAEVDNSQERFCRIQPIAILRVRKEHPDMLREALQDIGLHQVHVRIVRLHHASRDLSLFSRIHGIGNNLRIKSFKLLLVLFFVELIILSLVNLLLSFNQFLLARLPGVFSSDLRS